jgi:hypothetical protein
VAVEQMTGSSRAMVLVDDVDQLDELSRALLVSLLHARAVFVVATLRTTDGVDAGVAHLVKDEHLIPVTVRPLGAGTVEAVLHRVVGDAIEPTTLAQLVEASNGNPGVLRQLVESAWDAGTFVDRGGRWALDRALVHVSPTFELLVEQRLGGLGDREREAVELVAVAGGLALDVVTTIVEDTVLEHLEQRGLLQVADADGREEVALAHPLFGEVLRAQLPTMRSRRLRRMLADAVTALGAVDPRDRVRVVAWRLEGGGRVDAPLLAEAARLALVDGDDAMAERILARAAPADRSPEIVQLHAELMFRRGDTDAVEALLASLDDVDLADEVRGQILRRRVTNLFYGRGQFREGVDLLAQRLPTLSDPAARAGLEAYHVLLLAMAGRVRDAAARSEPLLDELRGGPRLELLRGRALALVAAARGADALALLPEARDIHRSLAAGLARPGSSMLTFIEVLALSELGRSEEAALAARRSLAGRSDVTTTGWIALAQARVHLATGETGAIREALDPLVRATRDLGHGATERWALALVASARLLEGDRDRAAEDLRRVAALEDGPRGLFHSDIDRAHAWLAAASDDRQGACDRLLVAADDAGRLGKAALEAALLHDVVRFGRPDLVAGRLGGLAGNGQGMLLSARALHAAGAAVDDPTLLAQAADGFEACGTTLLAAEAAAGAAASMEARDDPGAAAAHRRAATLRSRLVDGITTPLLAASSDRTVDV